MPQGSLESVQHTTRSVPTPQENLEQGKYEETSGRAGILLTGQTDMMDEK